MTGGNAPPPEPGTTQEEKAVFVPNPPAFPRTGFVPDTSAVANEDLSTVLESSTRPQAGMSLRDFFAAHALGGILAAHAEEGMSFPEDERAARLAFEYADACLLRRSAHPAPTA